MEKPIVLVIMDGVGKGDGGSGDAVVQAKTPTLDMLLNTCPHTYAKAHGGAVGFQVSMGAGSQQTVQSGGLGLNNSIAAAAVALTNAVHDH